LTGFVAQADDIDEHMRAETERERERAGMARTLRMQQRAHALQRALATAAAREDVYRMLDAACGEIFPGRRMFLTVREPGTDRLRRVAGDAGPSDSPDCAALCDGPAGEGGKQCCACGVPGRTCVALTVAGRRIGVVHLDGRGDGIPARDLIDTVETIAASVQGALSNIGACERLREDSLRDALTGLYNRRYLLDVMPVEIERARRLRVPLVLAFVDIDHFKHVNDCYGHAAGDEVLCRTADVLRAGLRRVDIVCRYGGEEFVVVMPATHAEPARQRLNELRMRLRGSCLVHQERHIELPTLSIGVAEFGPRSPSAESLLRAADAALYRAKASGRDRVELACADGYCGIWAGDWSVGDDA